MESDMHVKKKSQLGMIWRQMAKNRLALVGLAILIAMTLSSAFVSVSVNYNLIVRHDLKNKLQGMSREHPFGTDAFGRDLLLRIIYGTRISLSIGFISVLGAMVVGGWIGAFSGFYGGKTDIIVMRFMDMLMAIPSTLLAICIVSALGNGFFNLLLAIMVSMIPQFALIVRSSVLTIKDAEFVEAARASGTTSVRIILRHILPNVMGPIIVQATLALGGVILTAASLSFIGLGVQPPSPEWGAILTEGQEYMRDYPYLVAIPGLTIMLAVLACNFLGDGLRDALDPKLKD
jgi:peptide/nickel transport system permease protein